MAYKIKTYRSENYIEHEILFAGKYGRKGEKRSPRKKATPEQIKQQNQRNRENRLRRTAQLNFYPNDIWLTLTYPAGTRKSLDEVEKDIKKFQDGMRKDYKLRGEQFKWIKRVEIGKHGGIHVHYIINRIYGSELLIQKNWPHYEHYASITEEGGMEKLINYMTKPIPEEVEQLEFIPTEEVKRCVKYGTSRNLIRPEPEEKTYKKKTVRKLMEEDPEPESGFHIDKNSIFRGVNPYTGLSYIHYREIRNKVITRKIRLPDKE
jgi:hypothetical protein